MVVEASKVPHHYNILAVLFSWLLVASFIAIPGTFVSLQKSSVLSEHSKKVVQNIPLLGIASACYTSGGLGIVWLGYVVPNDVWLLSQILW
jgi:hypothetical protein